MDYKPAGQVAYEAYHGALYRKNPGHTWTWWADLARDEQDAWFQVAQDVLQKVWVDAR